MNMNKDGGPTMHARQHNTTPLSFSEANPRTHRLLRLGLGQQREEPLGPRGAAALDGLRLRHLLPDLAPPGALLRLWVGVGLVYVMLVGQGPGCIYTHTCARPGLARLSDVRIHSRYTPPRPAPPPPPRRRRHHHHRPCPSRGPAPAPPGSRAGESRGQSWPPSSFSFSWAAWRLLLRVLLGMLEVWRLRAWGRGQAAARRRRRPRRPSRSSRRAGTLLALGGGAWWWLIEGVAGRSLRWEGSRRGRKR